MSAFGSQVRHDRGQLLLAGYEVGALAITGPPFVTGPAAVRTVLYVLWLVFSPVRRLRTTDELQPGA